MLREQLARWLFPEGFRTQKEPHRDCVSREQLELALAENEKRANWLIEEWYEKFSTLHARAAKRAKSNGSVIETAPPQSSGGVLSRRKPWSV